MSDLWERVKSIPPALWIGAVFVIIIAFFLTRGQGAVASGGSVAAPAKTASTDLSPVIQQLSANQTASNKSMSDLSSSFNTGLKQIVALEQANNANNLAAMTSLSQADASRSAALQTGFQQGFQQLITVQQKQNADTAASLDKLSAGVGGFGSAITALGNALQSLKQQQSVVYVGGSEIPTHTTSAASVASSFVSTGAAAQPGVSSGSGGKSDQARSVAADIGSHAAIINGQIVTVNKTYAQASPAEKDAMNAFARQHPHGL